MLMINPGTAVVLRDAGGFTKPIKVEASQSYRVGRTTIPGSAIIGRKFGETVTLSDGHWHRCASTVITQVEDDDEIKSGENSEESREADLSSRAASAAYNSASFASKTKFSQEKYLLKKHKKYSKEITLLHASLFSVSCSNENDPSFSTVGLMLRYANATAGSRVMAFDDGSGLVIAGLLERGCRITRVLAGKGTASVKAVTDLGLKPSAINNIQLEAATMQLGITSRDHEDDGTTSPRAKRRKSEVVPEVAPFDSAIVCCTGTANTDTLNSVVEAAIMSLRDSCGELCLYTHYFEQASHWQRALRSRSGFINVGMREVLLREHQILPDRTHPLMQSQVQLFQGFLISATKVKGR